MCVYVFTRCRLHHNSSHCRQLAVTHSYFTVAQLNAIFYSCLCFVASIRHMYMCVDECAYVLAFFAILHAFLLSTAWIAMAMQHVCIWIIHLQYSNHIICFGEHRYISLSASVYNKFIYKTHNHLIWKVWVCMCFCCWFWVNVTDCIHC